MPAVRLCVPNPNKLCGGGAARRGRIARVLLLLLSVSAVAAGQGWYAEGGTWAKRKKITINSKRVAGSGVLADFPVLFRTADADLRTAAKGGFVSSGSDFAFTAADGVTRLAHEVERYDGETGALAAWVRAGCRPAGLKTRPAGTKVPVHA